VRKAVDLFGQILILCSANADKEGKVLFTPEECRDLWLSYDLPFGARVVTYDEMVDAGIDFREVVMVRGIRDDRDFEYEKRVMMDNYHVLGIDKFFLIVGEEGYHGISSTIARNLAQEGNVEELEKIVSAPIAQILIKKMKK
jgi:phosphopantetheine adenylyltransferase